jgi:hypothetical protein
VWLTSSPLVHPLAGPSCRRDAGRTRGSTPRGGASGRTASLEGSDRWPSCSAPLPSPHAAVAADALASAAVTQPLAPNAAAAAAASPAALTAASLAVVSALGRLSAAALDLRHHRRPCHHHPSPHRHRCQLSRRPAAAVAATVVVAAAAAAAAAAVAASLVAALVAALATAPSHCRPRRRPRHRVHRVHRLPVPPPPPLLLFLPYP